ncbi:MAG: hypothetical protein NTU53_21695 [Planctomycetota bacterium]|nr:hypothetical protein [Planctomycetota bacterium]
MNRRPVPVEGFERPATVVAIGGCTVVIVLLGFAFAHAAPAPREKAPNPHWKHDTCETCHTVQDGTKRPITPDTADEICLKCHDGSKAAMEFHPVARPLDPEKYARPDQWPLVNNRLVCMTCHDMKVGCVEAINAPAQNRMMLRNFQAGRAKGQPFCQNCHKEATYQKLNPHLMLLSDKDETIEEKCLFCHTKPLDRAAVVRIGNPSLKIDEVTLCRDCHPQHKDPTNQNHVGTRLTADMLATMYIREITGLQSPVGPKSIAQVKATGKKPTRMPVFPGDVILCTTCHNPHQAGVFPKQSTLSYRAMHVVDNTRTVSPVHNQVWCRHCHEF